MFTLEPPPGLTAIQQLSSTTIQQLSSTTIQAQCLPLPLPHSLLPPGTLTSYFPCDLKLASLLAPNHSPTGDPVIAAHLQTGALVMLPCSVFFPSTFLLSHCVCARVRLVLSWAITAVSNSLWAPESHLLWPASGLILPAPNSFTFTQCLLNKDQVCQSVTGGAPPKGTKLPFTFNVMIFPWLS